MLFVSNYYSRMDDHNQLQLLDECQKETGVYEDPAADARVQDVYQRIRDTGTLKRIIRSTYPLRKTSMRS